MAVDEPSDMDNFLPMLNDYLSSAPRFPLCRQIRANCFLVNDTKPTDWTPLQKPSASTTSLKNKIPRATRDDDDDYVWDVFYHRPATLSERIAAANNVGTM